MFVTDSAGIGVFVSAYVEFSAVGSRSLFAQVLSWENTSTPVLTVRD